MENSQLDDLDYFYRKLVRACEKESKDQIEVTKRRFDQLLDCFIIYNLTKRNMTEDGYAMYTLPKRLPENA